MLMQEIGLLIPDLRIAVHQLSIHRTTQKLPFNIEPPAGTFGCISVLVPLPRMTNVPLSFGSEVVRRP